MTTNKRHKEASPKLTKRASTVLDAAGELGISEETVRRDIGRGCPHEKRGRSIYLDVPEYTAWRESKGLKAERGRPIEGDSPDLEAARLRKENALASKYELQVARERAEVIPRDEVRQLGASAIGTFRNRLMGGAFSLAVQLEGRNAAESQQIIEEFHTETLNQLARDLEKLGVGGKAA